jgi:hypothetical protein
VTAVGPTLPHNRGTCPRGSRRSQVNAAEDDKSNSLMYTTKTKDMFIINTTFMYNYILVCLFSLSGS